MIIRLQEAAGIKLKTIKREKIKSKIYFYEGDEEGETMVPLTIKAFNEMHRVSKSEMTIVIGSEGRHNEAR